jgi:hypothetical protein
MFPLLDNWTRPTAMTPLDKLPAPSVAAAGQREQLLVPLPITLTLRNSFWTLIHGWYVSLLVLSDISSLMMNAHLFWEYTEYGQGGFGSYGDKRALANDQQLQR